MENLFKPFQLYNELQQYFLDENLTIHPNYLKKRVLNKEYFLKQV